MLTASSTYADIVEGGGDVELADTLTMYLNVSGYPNDLTFTLQSIDLDSQMTTDLPAGIRTEDGFTTTGGSFVLAGMVDTSDEAKNAAWFFNPHDPTSPLFRQVVKGTLVTYDLGVRAEGGQPETLRKFTGRVESFALDHDNGTVTFQLVDQLGKDWNECPDTSAVITVPPFNAGLTSEFLFDYIARNVAKSPRYTWPAIRSNCVLAVGLRTSLWAEVGTLTGTVAQPVPTFSPNGPYGSGMTAVSPTTGGHSNPTYSLASPITGDWVYTEFFVKGLSETSTFNGEFLSSSSSSSFNSIYLELTTTSIGVSVNNGTPWSQSTTIDGGIHCIALLIHLPAVGGTSASVTAWVDSNSWTGTATMADPRDSGAIDQGALPMAGGVYAGVQVTTESNPTPNYNFTPTAFIDPSYQPLQVPPTIAANADVWKDVIQQMAAAELGYARTDGSGNFRFTNRMTLRTQPSQRTVTSSTSLLTGLQTVVGEFTTYNRVDVDYSDYHFRSVRTIFAPTVAWQVTPHNRANPSTWKRQASSVFAGLVTTAQPLTVDGAVNPDGTLATNYNGVNYTQGSYYRASNDRYGNGQHDYGSLTVTAEQISPDHVKVTAENTSGNTAWLVCPAGDYTDQAAGDPALWIAGQPIVTDNPTVLSSTIGDATPAFSDTGNVYRQDCDAAQAVADWLLEDLHVPRPDLQQVSIRFDGRIEVGDRITLVDPDRSDVSATAIVWGWSFHRDRGDVRMTLNVRMDAPPGAWLLGVAGSSELGDGAGYVGTAYLY